MRILESDVKGGQKVRHNVMADVLAAAASGIPPGTDMKVQSLSPDDLTNY